ncbi:MAG: glycosyltransferase family 4 protein [Chroococcales cyanobacterium]
MRIAQVAALAERVPPPAYGGIELVVSFLTDELVNRGHDVTLFASGDSETIATLKSIISHPTRTNDDVENPIVYELIQLNEVCKQAKDFDIIHFHNEVLAPPFANLIPTPAVHTLHGYLYPDDRELYKHFSQQGYISISNAQREYCPELNYIRTVYNAIDINDHPFVSSPATDPPYLAFLGRGAPEKGLHSAIAIAQKTGYHLKIAAKIDSENEAYFEEKIKPHLDQENIEFLGEIPSEEKGEFLGKAIATLFPITWAEPFGLVMIESMAAGTPVIAIDKGSVSEIVEDGKTGFICSNVEEMIDAIAKIEQCDRHYCRQYIQDFFSVKKMVDGYEKAYSQLLNQSP